MCRGSRCSFYCRWHFIARWKIWIELSVSFQCGIGNKCVAYRLLCMDYASAYEEASMVVGLWERIATTRVLQPELAQLIQCAEVRGSNAYRCFHIRVLVPLSRIHYRDKTPTCGQQYQFKWRWRSPSQDWPQVTPCKILRICIELACPPVNWQSRNSLMSWDCSFSKNTFGGLPPPLWINSPKNLRTFIKYRLWLERWTVHTYRSSHWGYIHPITTIVKGSTLSCCKVLCLANVYSGIFT